MIAAQKHNWIGKPYTETLFITLLPFLCCLLVFTLPQSLLRNDTLPESAWLFLIVFVDVGHVYSTLYRTYADKSLVLKNKNLFFGLPILLFMCSVLLHSLNPMLFWRALAYLAVYHFIRQQYGFMRIYSRKNTYSRFKQLIDSISIYAVTLLPIVYWHFSDDRRFHWFVSGDFILGNQPSILIITKYFFWAILAIYTFTELKVTSTTQQINFQKNAILYGTALTWYVGIIYFNSDLVFTLLNVICHGIPYVALVWIHGKKKNETTSSGNYLIKLIYGQYSLVFFLIPLFLLAWFEEGLWDSFVWKEHDGLFPLLNLLHTELSTSLLNLIVPLLALPQLFHYVIDGFIWKLKSDKFEWTKIL